MSPFESVEKLFIYSGISGVYTVELGKKNA